MKVLTMLFIRQKQKRFHLTHHIMITDIVIQL